MSDKFISLDSLKEYNKQMKETYIKPLDSKVDAIPQADWNQSDLTAKDFIKNRPFGEDYIFNISWDGNTEGKDSFMLGDSLCVKVSDEVYSLEQLNGSTIEFTQNEESNTLTDLEFLSDGVEGLYVDGEGCGIIIIYDNAAASGVLSIEVSSNGIYFLIQEEGFLIQRFYKSVVKQIDEKYMPDNLISKLLPVVDETLNGKILQVVNGVWTVATPTVIYVGAAEPTNEIGADGDLYLQTD